MPIDLYQVTGSAPCRAVRLAAAAIGIELNIKNTDLMAQDNLKPEYIKMNPQHTVPTLDDNGFYLWESRAIIQYLADKYGKNDSLYPKDLKQRALVQQRLYFDTSLYQSYADYFYSQLFGGAPADAGKLQKLHDNLTFLDTFLDGKNYLAGNNLTIADLATVTTYSNLLISDIDVSKYKNSNKWFERIKAEAPKYEQTNGEGLKAFKGLMDHLRK